VERDDIELRPAEDVLKYFPDLIGEPEAKKMTYYVYMLSSQRNGTLYVGMTTNLIKRVYEHKNELADGFTKKHNIKNLVYFENYSDLSEARYRENRLKRWNRPWKMGLIEKDNPQWRDLYDEICK
jgi:putative endonuclease